MVYCPVKLSIGRYITANQDVLAMVYYPVKLSIGRYITANQDVLAFCQLLLLRVCKKVGEVNPKSKMLRQFIERLSELFKFQCCIL